jgi:hypothetical protein
LLILPTAKIEKKVKQVANIKRKQADRNSHIPGSDTLTTENNDDQKLLLSKTVMNITLRMMTD